MKKFISLLMVTLLFVCSLSMPVFAQEKTENDADFNLCIDYWNTAEQIYVINGIEFKVLASDPIMTKGRFTANKTVAMRDLYNDARLGNVYIYAVCVNDGTYVSASSYGSSIKNKPTTSDLHVTSTNISGNGTTQLSVTSNVAYTSSQGGNATGQIILYVNGNGTSF